MKKFTLASAKAFIKKNRAKLLIKVKSSYDGQVDGVEYNSNAQFVPAVNSDYAHENNLGINGVWFTHSANSFYPMQKEDGTVVGFECYNCCGSFVVKV